MQAIRVIMHHWPALQSLKNSKYRNLNRHKIVKEHLSVAPEHSHSRPNMGWKLIKRSRSPAPEQKDGRTCEITSETCNIRKSYCNYQKEKAIKIKCPAAVGGKKSQD
ncbi:hypothetical protein TNCT_35521 [Trichonephila clavata]|uniref:Uncharacterized protein n=1 Tax=Trichonephila clavata TaxID=2740835 RepID=A0A8X6L9Y4_TRICU|nr:hypothetical protein TNCT_35521 [Trichonephila clavata]